MQIVAKMPSQRVVLYTTAAIGAYLLLKKLCKRNKAPKIRKADWKEGTVYLYQFGRPAGMASLSPFCVKLEMFLRFYNIPYENCFITSARSKYGLVPFIEFNGVHYADSQLIVEMLKEKFNIQPLSDPRTEAFARTLDRMADNHSFPVFIKYKVLDNLREFVISVLAAHNSSSLNVLAGFMGRHLFKPRVESRLFAILGPYSDSEFDMLLRKDLDAYRDILGENDFMMGNEITPVDCTVFGQLATVCYLKYPTKVQEMVREEYPTLQAYQERIIQLIFPEEFKSSL